MHLLKCFHLRYLPLLRRSLDNGNRVTLFRAWKCAQRHVSCVFTVSPADGCGGDAVPVLEVIPSDMNDLNDHRQD